jgi:hypothetical protein
MIRPATLFLCAAVVAALAACHATPTPNRGQSGRRVDPTRDAPAELGVLTLRSTDLVNATDQMTLDIARRLDINNPHSPPNIVVGEIEDRTSMQSEYWQVFLTRLRAQLNQSGARHGLRFVRERSYVEQQRDREYGRTDPRAGSRAYRSDADFVLTCEVFDLPVAGTNYFLLDYQLVQLRESATGPDVGAGAIVWERSYEVKYQ